MPRLLCLFGAPRIESDGTLLRGRAVQRRRIGLLAALALAPGGRLSRDKLIALLWPELGTEPARKLLSEAIYVIRKELGEGVLASVGDDVLLDSDVLPVDLIQFRAAISDGQLGAAVAIYQGQLLDGWFVEDAPELENLIERERAAVSQEYAAALRRLASDAEARGETDRAVTHWRALRAHEPLSSANAIGLARALAAAGERAEAIQSLASYEAFLRAELEMDPDTEVVALRDALRREQPVSAVKTPAAADAVLEEPRVPQPALLPRRRRSIAWLSGLAAVVVFAGAAAVHFVNKSASVDRDTRIDSMYNLNRMAVLYFDDHSIEQDLGPIASGISDEVIHQLAGVNAFQVISRNGVKPYRNQSVGLDSIARALRVGSIVEGSVQRSGKTLRVTFDLIDARTAAHLDTHVVEESETELFTLETRIGQEIANDVRRRLGRTLHPRLVRSSARSLRAASLELNGEQRYETADSILGRCDPESKQRGIRALAQADSFFTEAAKADDHWSLPLVQRGAVTRRRASLEDDNLRPALYRSAIAYANEALKRDSSDARALELRGTAGWLSLRVAPDLEKDSTRKEQVRSDLESAVQHDSTLASAWAALSGFYRAQSKPLEAADAADRAFAMDAYLGSVQASYLNLIASEFEKDSVAAGRRHCARGKELLPGSWRFTECELTAMLFDQGAAPSPTNAWQIVRDLEARDSVEHFTDCGFRYAPIYWRMAAATIDARAGRSAEARAVLRDARVRAEQNPSFAMSFGPDAALLLHVLGDERAAAAIRDSLIKRSPTLKNYFDSDPRLKAIR